mgnify:CR=1 FL=1
MEMVRDLNIKHMILKNLLFVRAGLSQPPVQ